MLMSMLNMGGVRVVIRAGKVEHIYNADANLAAVLPIGSTPSQALQNLVDRVRFGDPDASAPVTINGAHYFAHGHQTPGTAGSEFMLQLWDISEFVDTRPVPK